MTPTRVLPGIGKAVPPLGLAPNYGLDAAGVREALERLHYVFWTPSPGRMARAAAPLREALKADRERYVIATGPTVAVTAGNVRRTVERALEKLDTDYVDLFQLHWLGVTSAWIDGTLDEMQKLKQEGKVKALGVSIHDRPRAGRLASDSPLDMLMIRYNAAHPGAERDIFPHLDRNKRGIVAYTATRWGKLLKRPRGWSGEVPTAGHCYRFCLADEHVDVCLTGPGNTSELRENLAALEQGPLSEDELTWMRDFGRVVHG